LYIIAGFQQPTAGEIRIDGKSLLSIPPNQRNIGMVFQRYTLFPHLTAGENVAFPLRVRRCRESEVRAKVDEMLKLVHLSDYRDRMPAQLSGGEQQRVAIARALAYEPALLLMDEPLSALDKKLREEMQLELRRIHRETNATILYVTHDQDEALCLSDRIAIFRQGKIEQVGTGKELYEQPASRFVGSFVGNSNFFRVKIAEMRGNVARAMFPDGFFIESDTIKQPFGIGDEVALMVRPEQMRIRPRTTKTAETALAVTVRDMTYFGDSMHFSVKTSWQQEITIRMPLTARNTHDLYVGASAWVDWDVRHGHVFAQ
jgi:putative spermidine/putrescine transport system ATP-binding protein